VKQQAQDADNAGVKDQSSNLRKLDARQRKALELFRQTDVITSRDVEQLFGISQRMARNIVSRWLGDGFLKIVDSAKKSRRYRLADQ